MQREWFFFGSALRAAATCAGLAVALRVDWIGSWLIVTGLVLAWLEFPVGDARG